MNHIEDSTQASLANLLMSRELSPGEYFNIALSSCSTDLTTVQAAVATVILRLDDEDARKTQLKTLYNQVFHDELLSTVEAVTNPKVLQEQPNQNNKTKRNKKKKKKQGGVEGDRPPVILWFRRDLRYTIQRVSPCHYY